MNKEKLLELSDTLRGIAEGKEWEYTGVHPYDEEWLEARNNEDPLILVCQFERQIRLKPPLDPYAELKAAHAAGKTIQIVYFDQVNGFTRINVEPDWSLPASSYRIKPEPQKLPLSQDDVKAGDEFLYDNYRRVWTLLCQETKLIYFDNGLCRSFEHLMLDEWKIRSIGETEWRDCYKLVEQ